LDKISKKASQTALGEGRNKGLTHANELLANQIRIITTIELKEISRSGVNNVESQPMIRG